MCFYYGGKFVLGNNEKPEFAASLEECFEKCIEKYDCSAWTYDPLRRLCHFKVMPGQLYETPFPSKVKCYTEDNEDRLTISGPLYCFGKQLPSSNASASMHSELFGEADLGIFPVILNFAGFFQSMIVLHPMAKQIIGFKNLPYCTIICFQYGN